MTKAKQKYEFAVLATDVVMFTVNQDKLSVLLIKMKKSPFTGMWALPGGLINPVETAEQSARRHLEEKTNVKDIYLEQLFTFSKVKRDPFGRVVSVAYFALIPKDKVYLKTTLEYDNVDWFQIDKLPKLAYDHQEIIDVAIDRLKSKLEYTNIVYSLMPKEFTLSELQKVYEIILGKDLDKRNFRKKLLSLEIVKETGKFQEGVANRPAELYRFSSLSPKFIELL